MVDFLSKHDFVVCVGQLPSEIITKQPWKLSNERFVRQVADDIVFITVVGHGK